MTAANAFAYQGTRGSRQAKASACTSRCSRSMVERSHAVHGTGRPYTPAACTATVRAVAIPTRSPTIAAFGAQLRSAAGAVRLGESMRWLRASQGHPIRTVEVQPPSQADEAGWVFLAAGFVLLGVIYTYGFEREGTRGSAAASASGGGLLPYQVLFRDLPSSEQRAF